MKKNRQMNWVAAALSVVGVALCASGASAITTWPANAVSVCQNSGTTGTIRFDWEGMVNTSTSQSANIDCGEVVNNAVGNNFIDGADIWVEHNDSSQVVSCTAKILDINGNTIWTGVSQNTSGMALGSNHLQWFSPSVDGLVYFSCTIPRAVGTKVAGVMNTSILTAP